MFRSLMTIIRELYQYLSYIYVKTRRNFTECLT